MKLEIDETLLRMAFSQDEYSGESPPEDRYLDRETGEIVWIGFSEDNELFESQPERYLKIPCLRHADHHELAQEFATSEVVAPEHQGYLLGTQDKRSCVDVTEEGKAIMGGMGVFIREAERLGYDYQDWEWKRISQIMADWLEEHGIEPKWKHPDTYFAKSDT